MAGSGDDNLTTLPYEVADASPAPELRFSQVSDSWLAKAYMNPALQDGPHYKGAKPPVEARPLVEQSQPGLSSGLTDEFSGLNLKSPEKPVGPSTTAAPAEKQVEPSPSTTAAPAEKPVEPLPSATAAGVEKPVEPLPSAAAAPAEKPVEPSPSTTAAPAEKPVEPLPSATAAPAEKPAEPSPSAPPAEKPALTPKD